MKKLIGAILAGSLIFGGGHDAGDGALLSPAAARQAPVPLPPGTTTDSYIANADFPVDMAWVKGTSKIFFTEKNTGRVRVAVGGNLRETPCVDLDVQSSGERGALGIVLDPRFKENHFLYVYYTNADPLENRVTRFVVQRNRCTSPRHIVTGITTTSGYHNGGQLEFVRGKLFVATGETHNAGLAQDTNSRLGKILRYNGDGSIPEGNPFSNAAERNPVWSYGHRNPFGLAHKPGTARIYSSENGPQCDDELNRIRPGRNYGWGPGYDCGTNGVGDHPKGPLVRWSSIIVPTDTWWYRGRLKAMSGSLYMGDFENGNLHRFIMNNKGTRVLEDRIVHSDSDGITDVSKGPGGWLYYLTPTRIVRIVRS
ncbi:MAG: sorbosone dehydrogenase family protein [Actinomycetota bacterium]